MYSTQIVSQMLALTYLPLISEIPLNGTYYGVYWNKYTKGAGPSLQ